MLHQKKKKREKMEQSPGAGQRFTLGWREQGVSGGRAALETGLLMSMNFLTFTT